MPKLPNTSKVLSRYKHDKTADNTATTKFIEDTYKSLDSLLMSMYGTTYANNQSYVKEDIDKALHKLKKSLPQLLYDAHNVTIDDIESDEIDIEVFKNLPNEVKSVKEGDTVIVAYRDPSYQDKNIPTKIVLLEFVLLRLDFISRNPKPLGISSHENPLHGSMIDITWCDKVVNKETYLKAVKP